MARRRIRPTFIWSRTISVRDTSEADRETIIRNFISGQYNRPLRVVSFNVGEGWCRDVSEDIAIELPQRAADAERDLPEATMAFIDRHGGLERKPPARSMTRQRADDEIKKTG
jgi:hypothetical protein